MAITKENLPPRPTKTARRYPHQYRAQGTEAGSAEQWCTATFGPGSNNAKSRWRVTQLPQAGYEPTPNSRRSSNMVYYYMFYFRHAEDAMLFELKWL